MGALSAAERIERGEMAGYLLVPNEKVPASFNAGADQPALLHADLTKAERDAMQARVEKLHRNWTKEREYLAPPASGKLAELDPAVVVTPPKGLEAGYVPIVTRQEAKN